MEQPSMRRAAVVLLMLFAGPAGAASKNMWMSQAEVLALPMSGIPWALVDSISNLTHFGQKNSEEYPPDFKALNNYHGVNIMAGALVWVRTGRAGLREKVRDHLKMAMYTFNDNGEFASARTLEPARKIPAYVIAADLIDIKTFDPAFADSFDKWLDTLKTHRFNASNSLWTTMGATAEDKSHNWSAHALSSLTAIAIYRANAVGIARCDSLFRALGDRNYFPRYSPWLAENGRPQGYYFNADTARIFFCNAIAGDSLPWLGIQREGCLKNISGAFRNMDGSFDDVNREPSDTFPLDTACCQAMTYSIETMIGRSLTAELLYRAGYGAWDYNDQQLRRAADFWFRAGKQQYPALPYSDAVTSKFHWKSITMLLNYRYGSDYVNDPTGVLGNLRIHRTHRLGWTDWTHARISCVGSP